MDTNDKAERAGLRRRRRLLVGFSRLIGSVGGVEGRLVGALGLSKFVTHVLEQIMANVQQLNDKIAELEQAVKDDEAQDDANEAALKAVIADLQSQVAAGVDLQPQIDALNAVMANLHAPTP
jgi:hypothetical protein